MFGGYIIFILFIVTSVQSVSPTGEVLINPTQQNIINPTHQNVINPTQQNNNLPEVNSVTIDPESPKAGPDVDPGDVPKVNPTVSQHDQPLMFTSTDIITFSVAAVLIMLAAGGGIGGGGVLVPTYIFVLGFAPSYAIPLSNATILGGSLANLLLNVSKRHPYANRPLVDWDIMLVMEPLTVAGALIGSFINILCPPWLLCILLVVLLTLTAIKSYKKGVKLYNKETEAMGKQEYSILKDDSQPSINSDWKTRFIPNANQDARMTEAIDTDNMELAIILKQESETPMWKVMLMFVVTGGMLILTILKGSGRLNPLNITCGTTPYWLITISALPFVLIISIIARSYLVKRYHAKALCNYAYVDGDVEWNEWHTIKYPLICSIAGLCAGMFGIGGGIVKGPLMLEMGVLPQVTSATSATMILFTSSAATVSYLLFETLNVQYGMYVFLQGFVFTLIGQKILNAAVKKSGRGSLIVLLIATIVGLSAVAMGLESSGSVIDLINGHPAPHKSLCAK